jgi:proline racemase
VVELSCDDSYSQAQNGKITAIKPSIQGWAKVFGKNCITIDDDDPYAFGFVVT